jgi:hypothetical protein
LETLSSIARGTWMLAPHTSFRWREWDQDIVVMSDLSGSTHLLSNSGAVLFRTIIEYEEAFSFSQLAAMFSEDVLRGQSDNSQDLVLSLLRDALLEFERIGLVEHQIP